MKRVINFKFHQMLLGPLKNEMVGHALQIVVAKPEEYIVL